MRCLARLFAAAALAGICAVSAAQAPKTLEDAPPSTGERRVALVIGNAAYRADPLRNAVNDARAIAAALRAAQFRVELKEDLGRIALFEALRRFADQLEEDTVAVIYYAGHGMQVRDRNYLVPVDADIRSEEEVPYLSVDAGFILERMSRARSRVNIVILDACRNNPFVRKGRAVALGLAPMEAPVGTLLAYATAPGQLALDGEGSNGVYTQHLLKHIPTPGLPVEILFRRVREGVVRETGELQVPWESSSLRGDFAFMRSGSNGVLAQPTAERPLNQRAGVPSAHEPAMELAFWESIQASRNAAEYEAYLKQYPTGSFAALAHARLGALRAPEKLVGPGSHTGSLTPVALRVSAPSAPQASQSTQAAHSPRDALMPAVGDVWRYRVRDLYRKGEHFVTAKVEDVGPQGIAERWSISSNPALTRSMSVVLEPRFQNVPALEVPAPMFAPYLAAIREPKRGQVVAQLSRQFDELVVNVCATAEGEESVTVPAGTFKAIKISLRGRGINPHARGAVRTGSVSIDETVWYAPEAKRFVKYTVSTHFGTWPQESASYELAEMKLN
jgi:uncharacterized caspase-like protein